MFVFLVFSFVEGGGGRGLCGAQGFCDVGGSEGWGSYLGTVLLCNAFALNVVKNGGSGCDGH